MLNRYALNTTRLGTGSRGAAARTFGIGSLAVTATGRLRGLLSIRGAGVLSVSGFGQLHGRMALHGRGTLQATDNTTLRKWHIHRAYALGDVSIIGDAYLRRWVPSYAMGSVQLAGTGRIQRFKATYGPGSVRVTGIGQIFDVTQRAAPDERTMSDAFNDRTMKVPA